MVCPIGLRLLCFCLEGLCDLGSAVVCTWEAVPECDTWTLLSFLYGLADFFSFLFPADDFPNIISSPLSCQALSS